MVTRPVPELEWVRSYRPEWRIISDDLWNRVQARRASRRHLGIQRLGGLERTKRSEKYLFSGLLYCGVCGRAISVIDTDPNTGVVRYGCGLHRNKAACTNATTIRRDCLEQQLLNWLTRDLLDSGRVANAAQVLYSRIQDKIAKLQAEARKNVINAPTLKKELAEKKQEAWNLTDCMAAMGRQCLETVQPRLDAAEARIKEIETLLSQAGEADSILSFSPDDIRAHLAAKLSDIQSVLTSEPVIGKEVLRRHINQVILTPDKIEGKRVLYVHVEFKLGSAGNSGVLLTGSMDAFSQQYGFSTIMVTGLALDTSGIRRNHVPPMHTGSNAGTASVSTALAVDAPAPTVASASAAQGILAHAEPHINFV